MNNTSGVSLVLRAVQELLVLFFYLVDIQSEVLVLQPVVCGFLREVSLARFVLATSSHVLSSLVPTQGSAAVQLKWELVSDCVVKCLELVSLVRLLPSILVAGPSLLWMRHRHVEARWSAASELHSPQLVLLEAGLRTQRHVLAEDVLFFLNVEFRRRNFVFSLVWISFGHLPTYFGLVLAEVLGALHLGRPVVLESVLILEKREVCGVHRDVLQALCLPQARSVAH